MAVRKMRMATRATRSDRLLGMVCGRCKALLPKARPCDSVRCQCGKGPNDSGILIEFRASTKKSA